MPNVLCRVFRSPELMRRTTQALALGLGLLLGGCASLGDLMDRVTPRAAAPAGPVADGSLPWGTPAGGAMARVEDPAYRIGPEDALEVSVWKDDTLKSTAIVRPCIDVSEAST